MGGARIRFYAELNDLLPPQGRGQELFVEVELPLAIKDAIEALGVPHTEIDLILVNGEPASWSHPLRPGDRVSVYPPFRSVDVSSLGRLQPRPPDPARFVLDTHLGKLATYLRLAGLDALYRNDYDDAELARISHEERRILLTRDRGLLKRNEVAHGYCVRSADPREQLVEVLRRYDLASQVRRFARCLRCNGLLAPVPKADVLHRLKPLTIRYYDTFCRCRSCGRVYWPGSHYERMACFVDEVLAEVEGRPGPGGAR